MRFTVLVAPMSATYGELCDCLKMRRAPRKEIKSINRDTESSREPTNKLIAW